MAKESKFKMAGLTFWDFVKSVPESAKKKITAGRQKGLTAINPTWRLEKMTEALGPVGFGWSIRYEEQTVENIEITGEKIVRINAYIKVKNPETGEWSEEMQGFGSAKLVARESKNIYVDDDAWKKASTDAISNALNKWGVGASVSYINADENKYTDPKPPAQTQTKTIKPIPPKLKNSDIIDSTQADHLEKLLDSYHRDVPRFFEFINLRGDRPNNPASDFNQLTYEEYLVAIEQINSLA